MRSSAAEALAKIGKPALPVLRNHLQASQIQWQILKVLYWIQKRLSPESQKILLGGKTLAQLPSRLRPHIYGLLSENYKNRALAAWLLGRIGPQAVAAVPALIQALKDNDANVREEAVKALAKVGPKTVSVVPAFIRALKDSDKSVRLAAAEALVKTGKPAVPALRKHLQDSQIQWQILKVLYWIQKRLSPESQKILLGGKTLAQLPSRLRPHIYGLLSKDGKKRQEVAKALGEIGPQAVVAMPVLVRALKDGYWRVRRAAVRALGRIGAKAVVVVPALIRVLKDREWLVRRAAAKALGKIGSKAAAPALIRVLKDREWLVRSSAVWALGKVGFGAREALPALIRALKDSDWRVRRVAAESLGNIGPQASSAVPALVQVLKDNDENVRASTAWALGQIGPKSAAVVPALNQALKDSDKGVRSLAAWALANIGPKAVAAVPALIQALKDSEWRVRLAAAYALLVITQKLHAQAQEILLKGLEKKPEVTFILLVEFGSKSNFAAQRLRTLPQKEKDPERRKQIQRFLERLYPQKSKEGQENGK